MHPLNDSPVSGEMISLKFARYKGEFPEELIREREWELDLEEARLKN